MKREKCCVNWCENLATSSGNGRYHKECSSHRKAKSKIKYTHKNFKKSICEYCGFVPTHPCQLDVDHIDGNKENVEEGNLQTLCANCHRLKTHLNEDWKPY